MNTNHFPLSREWRSKPLEELKKAVLEGLKEEGLRVTESRKGLVTWYNIFDGFHEWWGKLMFCNGQEGNIILVFHERYDPKHKIMRILYA